MPEEVLTKQAKDSPGFLTRLNYLVVIFSRGSNVLFMMLGLQIIWLAGIGILGASSDWGKLIGIAIYSVLVFCLVIFLSKRFRWHDPIKYEQFFSNEKRLILILMAIGIFIGVIYAFLQRIWVFDEEQNYHLAKILANHGFQSFLEEYTRSPYFANQHPFTIALIDGIFMRVFGVNLVVARSVSLLFCLGIIWLTYLCGREIADEQAGFLGAALLFTFPLILRLGTVAMLDIPVTFFFLLSIYLFLILAKKPTFWKALMLGLAIFAGFLSRYSGLFIIPVLLGFLFIDAKFRRVWLYLLGSLTLFGLFLIGYLWFIHGLGMTVPNISRFIPVGLALEKIKDRSVIPGWVIHSGEFGLWRWASNSLFTRLPSAIGVYNIPLILFGTISALYLRKLAGKLLLLWIVIVTILLIFTLPDHRYFMPTFPALALLAGLWLRERKDITLDVILLAMLLFFGNLYLFVDWHRETQLFIID